MRSEFEPAHTLRRRAESYAPDLAFRAHSVEEALDHQARVRPLLRRALGFDQEPEASFEAETVAVVQRQGYRREKVRLRVGEHARTFVYLLIPDGEGPWPTAVAFHGHGYGVADIVGLWEDGTERSTPEGYHADFATELCRFGFAVAAPEIACFGERQSSFDALDQGLGQYAPSTCHHAATMALHYGGTVLGMRVHEATRLLDYLSSRVEFDTGRLGVMGISGGGMLASFFAALEPRVRAAVVSGYFSFWRDSILAMHHCPCNYVPGLARFGEITDLAALIAPRPLFVEAGTRDGIFPIGSVREAVRRSRAIWEMFGVPGTPELEVFEGRHRIANGASYNWLRRALGLKPHSAQPAPIVA